MTINSLPADLASFVDTAVAAGKYDSPEAVVVAGLRLLQERESADEELRRKLQVGLDEIDRGEGTVVHNEAELEALFDEIERRCHERFALERRTAS